ncbi:MAG: putative lipid kinase [Candidatus Saccharibacteria bacterium]|nr:putative lipid kinase [Candidatus Saccharibacteria bacterium]
MAGFSDIVIVYNPNSTGDSKAMAFELRKTLRKQLADIPIECVPTEFAGHARELACQVAKDKKHPLIVSSSGDGGYNEVVNGIMDAGKTSAVSAVLPAGNANDHSRTMQKHPLADEIIKGKITHLDLIKVTVNSGKNIKFYHAHSYAGLGLTPVIGAELNRHDLNRFNEILLSLKTFSKFKPFKIRHRGKLLKLDSLLFGNINQMAKVLTISPTNRPQDGLFEVVTFPSSTKRNLIKKLVKAAVSNLSTTKRFSSYKFEVPKKIPMQLDGEIIEIPAGSSVQIESAHKVLATVI